MLQLYNHIIFVYRTAGPDDDTEKTVFILEYEKTHIFSS